MSLLSAVSSYIVPLFILISVICCIFKKQSPYSAFIDGAKEGIKNSLSVLPYLVVIFFSIRLFTSSGLAQIVGDQLNNILSKIGIPNGLGLFIILRPLSGTGAISELNNVFNVFGVDSPQGIFASALMSSTETIFYTIPVYLSPSGIKNSPKAMWISIISMIAGLLIATLLFNVIPPSI